MNSEWCLPAAPINGQIEAGTSFLFIVPAFTGLTNVFFAICVFY